ncbi:hypothetical protein B0J14DRAFT_509686 [Halenospora varia]|nr:hypothetical protein B0J14DRAFT_509686 [Halenospora varia]
MESAGPETLTAIEQKVCKDTLAKYMGSARVWITHLDFPHPSRQIDRKVIAQLKRDFDGEGCIQEKPDHRIPAIIEDTVLQAGLQRLAISAETFRTTSRDNPPQLHLGSGVKLECLHGQHRAVAAKEHLVPSLRWWIVDLYNSDLEKDTKQTLREGYSYSAKYTSGEIFRYIRLCNYDNDTLGVQRWRGRLSDSQNQFLTRLLKRGMLVSALDSVLHIQGLWRTFYLGSLDVFLNLKCDDEIACYIKSMKSILTRILGNDMTTMMNTDPLTIEDIQSRAPAFSKSDFEFIQKEMHSERLFAAVTDPVQRADITQRLLTTEEPIPSLYTLLKDIRYLKQPAAILITLLPKSRKPSLRQRFYFHFTRVESSHPTIEVEQNVSSYTIIPNSSHLDAFNISYQQLWLCAYRVWKHPNAYGRLQLATLAHRLGFSSTEIERKLREDPEQGIIEQCVLEVLNILRPNEKFAFDANQARELIASFHAYLGKILQTPAKSTPPLITVAGSGEPLARRCGHSSADTQDLENLFLDKIHASLLEYRRGGDEISSFYVKRSRHRAFFGAVNLAANQQGQSTRSVPAEAPVEQRVIVVAPSAIGLSSSASAAEGQDPNSNESSQVRGANQVVQSARRVVRFKERNAAIQEVPYERAAVNEQARMYANQGKKLSVKGSGHFIWQDCFDILHRTKGSTVHVFTTVQPVNGKRQYNQDMPERLQPVRKEAFDFEMEDSEEEL